MLGFFHFHSQPGDFVKLINLHAMQNKSDDVPGEAHRAVPSVALCLHGGVSYGRSIRRLDPDDAEVRQFHSQAHIQGLVRVPRIENDLFIPERRQLQKKLAQTICFGEV